MVKINDSRCVGSQQIAVILKRIERIKSEAIVVKKEGEKNELQKIME